MVGPDKKIKLMLSYPMSTGRNFDEVLRVLDSIQLTAKHKVATPVNWKPGDDVIIGGRRLRRRGEAEIPARLEIAEALYPYRRSAQVSLTAPERAYRPPGIQWRSDTRLGLGFRRGQDIRVPDHRRTRRYRLLRTPAPPLQDTVSVR